MLTMDKKEITTKSEIIFDGKVVHLRKDEVLCPNGNTSIREIVDHIGGVGVLFIKDNKILLIKQYRYAYDEILYEIPAGKREKGEEAYITGKRELLEETGYEAKEMIYLGQIYPTCGYSNEIIHLYLVKEATLKETHFDEDENIDSSFYSIEEIKKMIKEGTIKDAKTICALYYYLSL